MGPIESVRRSLVIDGELSPNIHFSITQGSVDLFSNVISSLANTGLDWDKLRELTEKVGDPTPMFIF